MNGTKIEIKNLNLTLSNNEILKNINLTINAGEIHCIVGPNGGGKSSLLKCILGQLPFEGEINLYYERENNVGYVPQMLEFEKSLPITVEDFMMIACQRKPCFLNLCKQSKELIDSLLEKLSMKEKKKRILGSLSGGERQRVLLAQALYPNPNLLILDEPLTGIDKIGEEYFKKVLIELKKQGTTILWIHHNLLQVKELADTVTCIKQEIIFSGDPKAELNDEDRIMRIFV